MAGIKELHIMKKTLLLLFALILLSVITNAQDKTTTSGGKAFDENSHVLNIGVGFGGRGYYNYTKNPG
jgi:hypothetical protein